MTGRLLVGLRWWNKVNLNDNSTEWIYESSFDQGSVHNKLDSNYFWTILYVTPIIWFALAIICVLKLNLSWLLIVLCALTLNGANLYGYWMCSKDQKQKLQDMMAKASFGAASSAFTNGLFGGFGGAASRSSSMSGQIKQQQQQQPQQSFPSSESFVV